MLQETMTKKKPLPRLQPRPKAQRETHAYQVFFPLPLWIRLVKHLKIWGKVARFVIEAVEEKLDREENK